MPRIRSIKPDMWEDELLGTTSVHARLLFVGLISQADDDGRLRGGAALLGGKIFPYDNFPVAKVEGWLDELHRCERIVRYRFNGEHFVALPAWEKHQRINRKTDSVLPPPPANTGDFGVPLTPASPVPHDTLSETDVSAMHMLTSVSTPRARALDMEGKGVNSPCSPPVGSGEAPVPAIGGRRRDVAAFTAAMTAWAQSHFPGADVRAVQGAVGDWRLRCPGVVVTAESLRAWLASPPFVPSRCVYADALGVLLPADAFDDLRPPSVAVVSTKEHNACP